MSTAPPADYIKITFKFPDGSEVNKYVHDYADKDLMLSSFKLKVKEAWRDYLFTIYGPDWRQHDPSVPGSFFSG